MPHEEHYGTVTESGRLVLDDQDAFKAAIRALSGKPVELTIRRKDSKRSLPQNGYLHSKTGPFRMMAEHTGDSIEAIKTALMGHCWGWHEVVGVTVPVKPRTSDMTISECIYFIDWVVPWAAMEWGVIVMLPNETDRLRWEELALAERERDQELV